MNQDLDNIWESFEKRYRYKKLLNILISIFIIADGIFSVIFIWLYDKEGLYTFRWMTVDGTIYTVLMSIVYIVVNIVEIHRKTELTKEAAYFTKLSSAVAECIIITIVIISWMPFSPDRLHVLRPDMFCMHILIPVLSALSFVINESPIGKLRPRELLLGSMFITAYASVIVPLILCGVIRGEMIPYFFLDFENMETWMIVGCIIFVYAVSCCWALLLSALNRKLYWNWFRNIAKK